MRHRPGPATVTVAFALSTLLAAGPAAARLPAGWVVSAATAQAPQPGLVVLAIPLGPQAEETSARVDYGLRNAAHASGRFQLARLPDLLDAENAALREGRVKEAEAALTDAKRLYNELDTIRALAEANRALEIYRETDLTRRMDDLVAAWIFKIASLVANGETKAAQQEMEKLLAVAPDAQFSTNFFPPDELAFAEQARAAVKAADGTLAVKTVPTGGEVYVNGKFKGIAPLTVTGLAPGDHVVTAKAPGYSLSQELAAPGEVTLTLRKSEAWPRYQAVLDKVKQDPKGPLRDQAAREFGTWAGVAQVILAVVEVPPGARTAKVTGLRLDAKDGHNYAFDEVELPLGEGALSGAEALGRTLLAKDDRRSGGPVTHFEGPKGQTSKVAGYALLGTGAALVATGLILGLQANGQAAKFRDTAQTDPRSDSIARSGRTFALLADLSYLTGLVAAGAGGYLAFVPGKSEGKGTGAKAAKAEEDDREAKARAKAEEERRKKEEEERRRKRAYEDDLRNY